MLRTQALLKGLFASATEFSLPAGFANLIGNAVNPSMRWGNSQKLSASASLRTKVAVLCPSGGTRRRRVPMPERILYVVGSISIESERQFTDLINFNHREIPGDPVTHCFRTCKALLRRCFFYAKNSHNGGLFLVGYPAGTGFFVS